MSILLVAGLTLAPLVVKVDPNLNVILTACLSVYVGCYRSVKPTPPSVSSKVVVFVSVVFLGESGLILPVMIFLIL